MSVSQSAKNKTDVSYVYMVACDSDGRYLTSAVLSSNSRSYRLVNPRTAKKFGFRSPIFTSSK